MAGKKKSTKGNEDRRIFKYWIELKSVDDGSVRVLPVQCLRLVPLVKEDHPMHGEERIEIRVQDGQRVLVGEDLGEIAAQLRARYPDGRFERFLRMQRDKDAELKYKAALDELAMVFVRAAVDDLLREEFASPHESLLGKNSSI